MKIKVGIFFGGPSREREISFAGGRTVYDNLDKTIFDPVPIFVDAYRNFILLDWHFIYKGSIRDFYPPIDVLPPSPNEFQIYAESLGLLTQEDQRKINERIGQVIKPEALPQLIQMAFLALHGVYGEDGAIQGELEALGIPYTGSGVQSSQIGMDKALQKELMLKKGFSCPEIEVIDREGWKTGDRDAFFNYASEQIGFPMVVRPANQGSSIGVSIFNQSEEGRAVFEEVVDKAFLEKQ